MAGAATCRDGLMALRSQPYAHPWRQTVPTTERAPEADFAILVRYQASTGPVVIAYAKTRVQAVDLVRRETAMQAAVARSYPRPDGAIYYVTTPIQLTKQHK